MNGSFASDTPIAVPDGMTSIADLSVGDEVLIGSPSEAGSRPGSSRWPSGSFRGTS
jgi:hypothetical protein